MDLDTFSAEGLTYHGIHHLATEILDTYDVLVALGGDSLLRSEVNNFG